jgi:hypothetical protein
MGLPQWSPFFALGLSATSGVDQQQRTTAGEYSKTIDVLPGIYLPIAAGLDYRSAGGLNVVLEAGFTGAIESGTRCRGDCNYDGYWDLLDSFDAESMAAGGIAIGFALGFAI